MSFMSTIRSRSRARRNRRAIERAIANAPNRSLRDELIVVAQRAGLPPRL